MKWFYNIFYCILALILIQVYWSGDKTNLYRSPLQSHVSGLAANMDVNFWIEDPAADNMPDIRGQNLSFFFSESTDDEYIINHTTEPICQLQLDPLFLDRPPPMVNFMAA